MNVRQISKTTHQAHKVYSEALGDKYVVDWSDTPVELRRKEDEIVKSVLRTKNISAEEYHKIWCEQRTNDGWKYGNAYDCDKKTDPLLANFEELTSLDKVKFFMYTEIVRSFTTRGRFDEDANVPLIGEGNVKSTPKTKAVVKPRTRKPKVEEKPKDVREDLNEEV